ncbi:hypothetical protein NDU88_003792 [Pleurodeles waltl]|uniref:Uncharacterized protein n=1 Tax=Pleurodeles waltl TaxID=8319 RepID=A0AAV7T6B7_PLEWA|nr:hypothetical protein NDU88_003792 [Pleurodeles waltl]
MLGGATRSCEEAGALSRPGGPGVIGGDPGGVRHGECSLSRGLQYLGGLRGVRWPCDWRWELGGTARPAVRGRRADGSGILLGSWRRPCGLGESGDGIF